MKTYNKRKKECDKVSEDEKNRASLAERDRKKGLLRKFCNENPLVLGFTMVVQQSGRCDAVYASRMQGGVDTRIYISVYPTLTICKNKIEKYLTKDN